MLIAENRKKSNSNSYARTQEGNVKTDSQISFIRTIHSIDSGGAKQTDSSPPPWTTAKSSWYQASEEYSAKAVSKEQASSDKQRSYR